MEEADADLFVWISSGPDPGENPIEYRDPRLRITAWKTWREASSVIDEAAIHTDNFITTMTGKLVKGLEQVRELLTVKADRLIDEQQSIVQYALPALSGEHILVNVDYDAKHRVIQNVDFALTEKKADGEYSYNLPSQEGQVQITYVVEKGQMVSVKLRTDFDLEGARDQVSKVLTVESEHGYLVDFEFLWQDGNLANVKVSPKVNPYAPDRIVF